MQNAYNIMIYLGQYSYCDLLDPPEYFCSEYGQKPGASKSESEPRPWGVNPVVIVARKFLIVQNWGHMRALESFIRRLTDLPASGLNK